MSNYLLTHKAVEDLSDIWNYTYYKWSESQADKYYRLIIDSCKEISENPNLGKSYFNVSEGLLG